MPGFIFDMDGTLMDTIGAWHDAEESITNAAGVVLSPSERDELNALTLAEAAAFFHERFGIMGSSDEVAQSIVDYMLNFYRSESETSPGVTDFLRGIQATGMPMCVLSSSPQAFLEAGLAHTGLTEFFAPEFVLSAEEEGLPKREAATFLRVCEKLGTSPEETWFFDDSWYALATAKSCGLRNVGVYSNDNCATHEQLAEYCEIVIDDFTEIDALKQVLPDTMSC